jgi:hypothetical protein
MTWVGSVVWGGATGFAAALVTLGDGVDAGLVVAGALLVAGTLDAAVVAATEVTGAGTDDA